MIRISISKSALPSFREIIIDIPSLPRLRQDDENMEKIHCAARKGQTERVKRLIEIGIDPALQNKFGCTALHLACKYGRLETAVLLAKTKSVNVLWHGLKPFHLAVLSNNCELVRALADIYSSSDMSFERLINENDAKCASEVGCHKKTLSGQTALHWCVGLGEEYLPMLEMLLELGASPSIKDKHGETALMWAIELNNTEAFEIIIHSNKSNLRLDLSNRDGDTSLMYAIRFRRVDMANQLLDAGCEVGLRNKEGECALSMAMEGAMPQILGRVLDLIDPFEIQSSSYHSGREVVSERINWLPIALELEKERSECIELFGKKLAEVLLSFAPEEPKKSRKKRQNSKSKGKPKKKVVSKKKK